MAIALTVLALAGPLATSKALADAGHDHGAAAPTASIQGLPRFAATSDLFELVGVLNGKQLTLYLDRSADNTPVKGAQIELELGGGKVETKLRAEGEFEAILAQPLKPGTIAVTATVVADQETDLLAGEFVVPEVIRAEASQARSWQRLAGWAAAGLSVFAAVVWLGRRALGQRAARIGGAA
jgi:hypothetical protein